MRILLMTCAALVAASCASSSSFSGTYVGNEAASVMPPGQHVPPNFLLVIEESGAVIRNVQTFTADSGEHVRLVWRGECDGKDRPVEGAAWPGIQQSCRRGASGSIVNTVTSGDLSYVETCVMESKLRMTCGGTMPNASGQSLPFAYVFDRQ